MMDGIKSLAELTFERAQKFRPLPPDYRYNVIEIGAFDDGPTFNEWLVEADDLPAFMTKEPVDGDDARAAEASLKLVCIPRDVDVTLAVSKGTFKALFETMDADPCALYMIARDYDGFHEFNGSESPVTTFVGTPTYAIVWTFNRQTMATRALFLRRRPDPWCSFRDVLDTYRFYLFTPHLLSFVSCLHMLRFFDEQTNEIELQRIRLIEAATGFGSDESHPQPPEPIDTQRLTRWAQATAEVQTALSNALRHQKTSRALLDHLSLAHDTHEADVVAPPFLDRYHRSMEALVGAVPALERHMDVFADYAAYLADRAGRLGAVLSALLARHCNELLTADGSPLLLRNNSSSNRLVESGRQFEGPAGRPGVVGMAVSVMLVVVAAAYMALTNGGAMLPDWRWPDFRGSQARARGNLLDLLRVRGASNSGWFDGRL